jgi:hypothetical protein
MIGPPRVMISPLVAVAGFIGAMPFDVGEARSYGRAFSAEF